MNKLIHVVEDDDDIRFIVEYILIETGYNVTSSATAREFNDYLNSAKPHLVILDVMLPDGNGIDLCRKMRSDDNLKDISIIIMSAHAAEKAVIEQACADDFISKPFDLDQLIAHVKKILPAEF
ncbi:MAG TPA: response regulator transcription factor [Pedobacter sp.]|nr:response regulator transcription factor [Pedobacter sp.]